MTFIINKEKYFENQPTKNLFIYWLFGFWENILFISTGLAFDFFPKLQRPVIGFAKFGWALYFRQFFSGKCKFFIRKIVYNCEENSHDRLKMTEWIWSKFCENDRLNNNDEHYLLNMTEKQSRQWPTLKSEYDRNWNRQLLMFIIVVIFRSYSNQFLVIFIRSCALASVQVESSHHFLMDFDVWFHLGPVVLCLSDLVVSHCVDFCIVVGPVQPVGHGGSVVSPWRVWRHKFDSFSEFNVSL